MELKYNRKQFDDLLSVAIKYSIIVFIATLSSFCVPLSILLFNARPSYLTSTDGLINIICLYLQFKFANKKYVLLCGTCHLCIEKNVEVKAVSYNMNVNASQIR